MLHAIIIRVLHKISYNMLRENRTWCKSETAWRDLAVRAKLKLLTSYRIHTKANNSGFEQQSPTIMAARCFWGGNVGASNVLRCHDLPSLLRILQLHNFLYTV